MRTTDRIGVFRQFDKAGPLTMWWKPFFSTLSNDRRGVAMVEFALWTSLIFGILLLSLDFAFYTLYKERLKRAVSEASLAAFYTKDNIDPAKIAIYVSATAGLPGNAPAVSLKCNGASNCVNSNRTYACLSGTDGTFTVAASANAACSSGGLAGYYLTISSSYQFHNIVLPNPLLDGRLMRATATVRLQ